MDGRRHDPCRQIWGNQHQGLDAELDVYGKVNVSLSQGVAAERGWQAAAKRAAGGTAPAKSSL